jgi:hypothetical protein
VALMIGALAMVASTRVHAQAWIPTYSDYSVTADSFVSDANSHFGWQTVISGGTPSFSVDQSTLDLSSSVNQVTADVWLVGSTGFNDSKTVSPSYSANGWVIWEWDSDPGSAPDEHIFYYMNNSGSLGASGTASINSGAFTLAGTASASADGGIYGAGYWSGDYASGSLSLTHNGYTQSASWVTSYTLFSTGTPNTSRTVNNSVTYSISVGNYLSTGGGVPALWCTGTYHGSASATLGFNTSSAPLNGSSSSSAVFDGAVHFYHY